MTSFLDLPRELRDDIYIQHLRNTTFVVADYVHLDESTLAHLQSPLAILRANRQIHDEVTPLLLKHIEIYFESPLALIKTLVSFTPAQICQLRHITVAYDIFCVDLPDEAELADRAATGKRTDAEKNLGTGFHIGHLLSLFSGLRLDLLEIEDHTSWSDGIDVLRWYHGRDLVQSLLNSKGFKEVRAVIPHSEAVFAGDGRHSNSDGDEYGRHRDNIRPQEWKAWIEYFNQACSPGGSKVEIFIEEDSGTDQYWSFLDASGLTLNKTGWDRDEAFFETPDGPKPEKQAWNFRAFRGSNAKPEDYQVSLDDDTFVIQCIDPLGYAMLNDGGELQGISDRLRALFKDRDWDKIESKILSWYFDGPYLDLADWLDGQENISEAAYFRNSDWDEEEENETDDAGSREDSD